MASMTEHAQAAPEFEKLEESGFVEPVTQGLHPTSTLITTNDTIVSDVRYAVLLLRHPVRDMQTARLIHKSLLQESSET